MVVSFSETYQVLVVDGDPLAASLHSAYVDACEGFLACGTATTCRQALTLARLRAPDVVLLDLSLDGVPALLRRLPQLPIVGITSVHQAPEAVALRRWVRSFLLKPFLLETFGERLEQCTQVRLGR